MPGFDGAGPSGRGPMSGQGRGFCILKSSETKLFQLQGFAGLQGVPVDQIGENLEGNLKKKISMQIGDGTDPAGMGPMTVRAADLCAGYPVPDYMNPTVGRAGFYGAGITAVGPYSAGVYGYGMPYASLGNPWFRSGVGFGRGFGRGRDLVRGRGRGRFGHW